MVKKEVNQSKHNAAIVASALLGMFGFFSLSILGAFTEMPLGLIFIFLGFLTMSAPAIVVVYFNKDEPVKEKPQSIFCSYCGANYLVDKLKCPQCGAVNSSRIPKNQ